MARHPNKESMTQEALQEMIEVARYCIDFDKSNDPHWAGYSGCYGYPGALLLLSIVDAIGADIIGGGDDVKKHFEILNHEDYYNLNLENEIIEIIRNEYRNYLAHNAHIGNQVTLSTGQQDSPVLEHRNSRLVLNLIPFLEISEIAVRNFIDRNYEEHQ